ncbi:MAG: TPM domain-containing protein [Burkholderiaceae bacterium]
MRPDVGSTAASGFWARLSTLVRHRWRDESDTHRVIDAGMRERLRQRVAASETRHTGEIRIYIEAGLPMAYLWRHLRHRVALAELVRARATEMFGRLRVWDTEHNNGVLIYLLLCEHQIELVADRGLNRHVGTHQWQAMVQHMGDAFAQRQFEEGLTQALAEVSVPLVAHFPAQAEPNPNDLPDMPVLG